MSQPSGAHGETGATETKTNAASTDATLNARVKSPKPSGFNKWIPIIIAAVVTLAVIIGIAVVRNGGKTDGSANTANTADTVTIGLKLAPVSLDIRHQSGSAIEQVLIGNVYEALLSRDSDNQVQPGLAKSWDISEDGKTYTFHLRQAKWSDGQTVTAGDFVYAWQRLADPVTNSPSASLLSAVAGYDEVRSSGDVSKLRVSAEGELTFVVTLLGKCDWFLEDVCTDPATMPLRQDNLQTLKEEAIQKNLQAEERGETGTRNWAFDPTRLVTNGPYTASRGEEGELILTRSETYVGGVSGPEELRFLFSHELHHLQRRDIDTKVFLAFCQGLCWFNPLVWLAAAKGSDDLELSCDETVLRRFGGDVRAAYARVLIRMEAAASDSVAGRSPIL